MKRNATIAILVACLAGIAVLVVIARHRREARKRAEIERTADAIQQFSTGSGWSFPPPLETIHSNIVIDGGTIEVENEVIVHQPTPWDLQEENQRRIRNMALIDDRPRQETTEPQPAP